MPTYPNEVWPADTVVEAMDGTTDVKTGLPFVAKGVGPTSTPSYEVQYNRRLARLNGILAAWRQGMVVDEGSLKVGVYPVEFTLGGVRQYFDGASGVSIPDNSANVVYLDSDALLHVADDWPSDLTNHLPLATVSAVNGELTVDDRRPRTAFHVPSMEVNSVRDRRTVTAHRSNVGHSQSGVEVFKFDAPQPLTLEQVQVYCSAATAAASVDVKESGTSVLSAPAVVSAGTVVKPTISDASIAAGSAVSVHVTTDASGEASDLTVTLTFKAALAA